MFCDTTSSIDNQTEKRQHSNHPSFFRNFPDRVFRELSTTRSKRAQALHNGHYIKFQTIVIALRRYCGPPDLFFPWSHGDGTGPVQPDGRFFTCPSQQFRCADGREIRRPHTICVRPGKSGTPRIPGPRTIALRICRHFRLPAGELMSTYSFRVCTIFKLLLQTLFVGINDFVGDTCRWWPVPTLK